MEVTEKVIEILKSLCSVDTIDISSDLRGDLLLDSLMMVSLIIEIEEKFDIELGESDMDPLSLVCVEDVVSLVNKYLIDCENEVEEEK